MELLDAVSKHCDIRRMKRNCNFRDCGKKPGKEMLIFQVDMDTRTKKNIMSVYLCSEHFKEMEKNLEGVTNRFREGRMYVIKGIDIGYVTY
jgi:hypothetical protein